MKTFKDLKFEEHPAAGYGFSTQAIMDFDNNYGLSVITGSGAYTSSEKPYEVAIMYNGKLTYTSGITDDVIRYQTADDVSEIMKRVQELK